MIKVEDNLFSLTTRETGYLLHVTETGHLEHLYYGPKLRRIIKTDIEALRDKHHLNIGTGTAYSEACPTLFLENLCQETSTEGKGDYRTPMLTMEYGEKGLSTLDFVYKSHVILKGKPILKDGNAQALGNEKSETTLIITLKEKVLPLTLELFYTTFEESDCIVRRARVTNNLAEDVVLTSFNSLQLDLFDDNWDLTTFNGAWGRERIPERQHLRKGTFILESRIGVSSADANPLLFLSRPGSDERSGEVIGCNLIYSGNHRESVEVSPYGKTRLLTGLNCASFRWRLSPRTSFITPEAVLTYSASGFTKASSNFHAFVNTNIVRGIWKYRERPVLMNNWEATFFDFTDERIMELANLGHELGVELFVLDDGWFGSRNDDTSSLGDWTPNPQKLPMGLFALAGKIHRMGMMFGIWVEPEMVSRQSLLSLKHPDWTIAIPGRESAVGRHQYILDLTRREVRSYLFDALSDIFRRCDVNYVKWDMNRAFSDLSSLSADVKHMGEFNHRYVLALYELLGKFTKAFPNVLFEGCASGGNRFDLGMLCYFSQIWTSDNTDAHSRVAIQEGTSYGYPLSTMGSHVSGCPNNQTLRTCTLDTRFNIAAFGAFGYELDLTELTREEKRKIADQITFYKQFRSVFQYGAFTRDRHDDIIQWTCASADKSVFLTLWMQPLAKVNAKSDILTLPQAEEDQVYDVFPREQTTPLSLFGSTAKHTALIGKAGEKVSAIVVENFTLPGESEHYTVSGSVLKHAGIKLNQQFSGTGMDDRTRVLGDFGSRLYIIRKR